MIEVAQNFKEQGNDYFKGRRYREAQGFYTQGIDAKPADAALLEALLCNRAACNLELRGFPCYFILIGFFDTQRQKTTVPFLKTVHEHCP